jgi:hypothetical protein
MMRLFVGRISISKQPKILGQDWYRSNINPNLCGTQTKLEVYSYKKSCRMKKGM